jgi:hypothetical protein
VCVEADAPVPSTLRSHAPGVVNVANLASVPVEHIRAIETGVLRLVPEHFSQGAIEIKREHPALAVLALRRFETDAAASQIDLAPM